MENIMFIKKAIENNPIKNNSGSSVQIGNSSTLNNLNLGLDNAATGSVVVDGDNTDKSVYEEVFAKNTQRPLGQRLADSPSLVNGSSYPSYVRNVNSIETFDSPGTATAFRAGYFNMYTGKWSTSPTVSYDNMNKSIAGSVNIDNAAHVSRLNTGSLTYLNGAKIPVNQNYESKRT